MKVRLPLWRRLWAHPVGRYAGAVLLTAAALLARLAILPWVGRTVPFIFFFPVIMASGLLGGLGPGVASVLLSAIASAVLLMPLGSFHVALADIPSLLIFMGVGALLLFATETSRIARERLETELSQRRELLDQLQAGFVVLDSDGRCRFANVEASAILGIPAGELLGRDAREFFEPGPDAAASLASVRNRGHADFEAYHAPSSRWLLVRAFSTSQGLGVFFLDVTERKGRDGARRLLAAIVDSSDDAIISKDLEGRITSWNAAAQRIFGYTESEMIGESIAKLLPEDRPDDFLKILGRVRSGERVEHYQTKRRRRDGTVLDVSLTVSPILDETGRIVGASKICRDVTQLKAAEAELARTQDLFLGMLGHDLRNPLNTIVSSVYSLEKQASAEARPVFGRISRATDRMARMIGQLLDFTRARLGGGIPLRPVPGDLVAICAAVLEDQQAQHPGRVRFAHNGSLRGHWDPDRVGQLVSNLLGNALAHGAPGEPVTLGVEASGGDAVIEVSNSGPPIPAEDASGIFQPFRRVERPGSTGLGLGLFIVREIVRSHRGTVELESTGERTTFRVRLPRRDDAAADTAPVET